MTSLVAAFNLARRPLLSSLGTRTLPVATRAVMTRSSSTNLVRWDLNKESKIGTITLQSPETLNALTMEIGKEFSALCHRLQHELTLEKTECAAIVLMGEGTDAFSAGGDFDWLLSFRNNSVHANTDIMLRFYNSFLCLRKTLPVPVIAALQGPAIGAGAGLALACDLRTAAPRKKILGFTFSKLGIHSGMGGSHLLQSTLGGPSAVLNEILFTGKILSGQEAYDLGLVNRLEEDAKDAAYQLAHQIAKQHPVAIRTMLQTVRLQQDRGLEEALHREALAQAVCYSRSDWGEGVNAVANKREPSFDGYHDH